MRTGGADKPPLVRAGYVVGVEIPCALEVVPFPHGPVQVGIGAGVLAAVFDDGVVQPRGQLQEQSILDRAGISEIWAWAMPWDPSGEAGHGVGVPGLSDIVGDVLGIPAAN